MAVEPTSHLSTPVETPVAKKVTSKDAKRRAAMRKRRNRTRRLAMMVLLTLGVVALGLYSVTQVWYTTTIPSVTVVDKTMHTVEGVTAHGEITGFGLANQAPAAPIATMGDPMLQNPGPGSVAGLPQPAFFLLALGICALLGGLMRQGLVTALGVVCGFFSWRQLVALRSSVENPNFGGAYVDPGPGLGLFEMSLALSSMLLLMVTIQVVLVNAEQRKRERARAKRNNEPITPTVLEVIHSMAMSQVSRMGNVSSSYEQAKEKASTAHLTGAGKP